MSNSGRRAGRRGTRTSRFGSPGRVSHDSTPFYSRRLYAGWRPPRPRPGDLVENPVPGELLDRIVLGDAREVLRRLPSSSVHLMVTSPPYNAGKEYDEDLTLGEYLEFIGEVMGEVYRVLAWGGRACFNVADLGRRPFIPLHAHLVRLFEELGFLLRGIIVWDKGDAVSGSSTAWGTWMSPVNPVLRDQHEYIIVLSKGDYKRKQPPGREPTITREEFLEYTRSVWRFPPESARRVGHPAPFPLELPRRCIQLYTFRGDVVLDPFAGSGTTCLAAAQAGRHYICIDNNPEYVKLAEKRLEEAGKHVPRHGSKTLGGRAE